MCLRPYNDTIRNGNLGNCLTALALCVQCWEGSRFLQMVLEFDALRSPQCTEDIYDRQILVQEDFYKGEILYGNFMERDTMLVQGKVGQMALGAQLKAVFKIHLETNIGIVIIA